ncbi:MAG: LPS assembly protein LptD [Candidatus Desulfatibia sp.]|uniref:LPS-assembly protein LptD n=1 Tax=Candidatus Desulfatibia sp. TaxID=3101189 RepID=UPI002F2EF077
MPGYVLSNPGFQSVKDDPNQPWHINADEISYDKKLDQYIAKGNVAITKNGKSLTADFVRFDQKTSKVVAVGHVIMTVGDDVLIGNRMEMDLETETGTVYNGTIFLKANHYYIRGDKIQKTGPDSYTAEKGCLTTCDGDRPAWKITGKNVKVTIEGYGYATNATLWARNVPVLYSPWLMFPVKQKRQTGLLPPQIGYSDRRWEEYNQPFFLVIDDSKDATFYLHHMGRRGDKIGLEYRYILDENSKGTIMYDYLNDRKVDGGDPIADADWGYFGDSSPRPNSDRYWFRMKHDTLLPFAFSAKLDIDFVSDQDYLKEFKYGYTGFEETNEYFLKTFGRELDAYNDAVRANRLNLNRSWSQYSLNGGLHWYDNVINRRQRDTDTTQQQLPYVGFNASKQQILTSSFYYDLASQYRYSYSEDGQRDHRAEVYPRFYLPYKFKNYFSIEPSLGLRETMYHFDKYEYRGPTKEENLFREMYDFKVDLSSDIYKIYSGIGKNIDKIKHAVRPQIVYTYIPHKDQSDFPSGDRIGKQRVLSYSLTNTLTSKSLIQKKEEGMLPEAGNGRQLNEDENSQKLPEAGNDRQFLEIENDRPPDYSYNQFLRFSLSQSYDINEAKEDKDKKQPFSAIFGEIDITPDSYYAMHVDATRSQYNSFWAAYNVAGNIWDKRGDSLFVERRYRHSSSDSMFYDLNVVISDKLSVFADYERNRHTAKDIRKNFGFLYKPQCWALEANYTHEGNDRSYMFVISLYGIGEFAHSIMGRRLESPYLSK